MPDDNRPSYPRRSPGEGAPWREPGPRSGRDERRSWLGARGERGPHGEAHDPPRGGGGYGQGDDRYDGGGGSHSGYGSSGQGAYGPGGFAQGRYGQTGHGRDLGQGDPAGAVQPYGGGHRAESAWDGDFEPDYLHWRQSQLAGYDRDYARWREAQARSHDDEYRAWRDERRSRFHEDFHSWRRNRVTETGATAASEAADPAVQNIADGGKGRQDSEQTKDKDRG